MRCQLNEFWRAWRTMCIPVSKCYVNIIMIAFPQSHRHDYWIEEPRERRRVRSLLQFLISSWASAGRNVFGGYSLTIDYIYNDHAHWLFTPQNGHDRTVFHACLVVYADNTPVDDFVPVFGHGLQAAGHEFLTTLKEQKNLSFKDKRGEPFNRAFCCTFAKLILLKYGNVILRLAQFSTQSPDGLRGQRGQHHRAISDW